MPRQRSPKYGSLPPALAGQPFSVSEALNLGVSYSRLRADDLVIPTAGARTVGRPSDLITAARAFAAVIGRPHAFSHLTALAIWGLPLPSWVADRVRDLHITVAMDDSRVRRPGVIAHRGLESRRTSTNLGLTVTAPLDTWLDCAPLLSRDELVAVGDVLANEPFGYEPAALVRLASEAKGRRGVRRAREAAALVRVGARSPKESQMRCVFHDHGLPEPELNVDIYDDVGAFIACSDFVWHERRVVCEYDGDWHRTHRDRWQVDRERRARLEDMGWTYVECASNATRPGRAQAELLARLKRLLLR